MYISSQLRNYILVTRKIRKGFTFYEIEHQNNVDVALVLYYLSLNFESIYLATLTMHFVDWLIFANVKIIVLAFIRNSIE